VGGTVTRPAGTTPRGLPYPGSAGIHANTPAALQALAEAVDAQMNSLGAGVILDTFTGKVRLGPGTGYGLAQFAVTFPNLATVIGAIASYGTFLGGPALPMLITAPGVPNFTMSSTDPNKFSAIRADHMVWVGQLNVGEYPEVTNTDITVCALGWGAPK
jgi:hypothetical protein